MDNIKIAFQLVGGNSWQAGSNHLKVFLHALKQTYPREITLCLLIPDSKHRVPNDLIEEVDEIVKVPALRRWTAPWAVEFTMKRLFSRAVIEESILKRHKIEVVFGLMNSYRYSKIPTLSWIPDFQHVHLPEMFSLEERLQRDRTFLRTAKLSTRIALMSEAVKKDFEAFAPMYAHKARVLHTASYIPVSIYETDPKSIANLYHLSEKFIYLPNQFWKHKNHEIVLRALKILKDKNIKVFVVCSGYPGDDRHPTYFSDLLQKISQWGIRNQVTFLGLLPYEHVLLLIRQSICVLNPSLFEGFGLTVDEAKSIGKQVLLSDIPVHREQNPPKAVFFDPQDDMDLANKLEKIWCETLPGPDTELETKARQSLPERIRMCAESFMAVVKEVVNQ